MAVNCYLTLNAASIYPELPITRERIVVAEDRRMLNGNLRRAYRAIKRRFVMTIRDVDETTRAAWVSAAGAGLSAGITFTDEGGITYTVVLAALTDTLARTEPAVEGGAATTGPGYYDLEVTLEEV